VISLFVSLPIRRDPGAIMTSSVQEHHALNNHRIFSNVIRTLFTVSEG